MLLNKLLEAGFDKTKKTLFLWQSVSLYLEADIVKETLRKIVDLCVDGSIIALDFYSKRFFSGEYSKTAKQFMGIIEKMSEINQFGEKLDIEPFYCIVEAEKL